MAKLDKTMACIMTALLLLSGCRMEDDRNVSCSDSMEDRQGEYRILKIYYMDNFDETIINSNNFFSIDILIFEIKIMFIAFNKGIPFRRGALIDCDHFFHFEPFKEMRSATSPSSKSCLRTPYSASIFILK